MAKGVRIVAGVLACGCTAAALLAQTPPADTKAKVPVVTVTGCLKQEGNDWFVTNASEPETIAPTPGRGAPPASATPPAPPATPTGPMGGKNKYHLIGLAEFDVMAIKDHAVVARGLFIKASPISRINLTSLKSVANACAAAK